VMNSVALAVLASKAAVDKATIVRIFSSPED
jgi:hypothetical protein